MGKPLNSPSKAPARKMLKNVGGFFLLLARTRQRNLINVTLIVAYVCVKMRRPFRFTTAIKKFFIKMFMAQMEFAKKVQPVFAEKLILKK